MFQVPINRGHAEIQQIAVYLRIKLTILAQGDHIVILDFDTKQKLAGNFFHFFFQNFAILLKPIFVVMYERTSKYLTLLNLKRVFGHHF